MYMYMYTMSYTKRSLTHCPSYEGWPHKRVTHAVITYLYYYCLGVVYLVWISSLPFLYNRTNL